MKKFKTLLARVLFFTPPTFSFAYYFWKSKSSFVRFCLFIIQGIPSQPFYLSIQNLQFLFQFFENQLILALNLATETWTWLFRKLDTHTQKRSQSHTWRLFQMVLLQSSSFFSYLFPTFEENVVFVGETRSVSALFQVFWLNHFWFS